MSDQKGNAQRGPAQCRAIWFSRNRPTTEQLADSAWPGSYVELLGVEEGMALGAKEIRTAADVKFVLDGLQALIRKYGAQQIRGVFPAPIQSEIATAVSTTVTCLASWNIQRSLEGEKPSFSHFKWVFVGRL